MTEYKPLIVGVGGLLVKDDNGRVSDILSNMRDLGCSTYEIRFSKICRNGDTVVCPVSLDWARDIQSTIETALNDSDIDPRRVGLIGSSLGATMIDRYLAENNQQLAGRKLPYVAIGPFSRLKPQLRPTLEFLRNSQKDLDMSSETDKEKGIKRIIPYSDISTILEIDSSEILKEVEGKLEIIPLTIYGSRDERVEVDSVLTRHKKLNGIEENLKSFDCGHNTPYKESIDLATDFLKSHLLT